VRWRGRRLLQDGGIVDKVADRNQHAVHERGVIGRQPEIVAVGMSGSSDAPIISSAPPKLRVVLTVVPPDRTSNVSKVII
jgi:hypothetical protein